MVSEFRKSESRWPRKTFILVLIPLTDNVSSYTPECLSTINTELSLGSGLTCCLSSLCGGRSTMVTLYAVQLFSKTCSWLSKICLGSSIRDVWNRVTSSSIFESSVLKLSKLRAPTSSQMLHSPAISTISLKLPAVGPFKNFVSLIGLVPCLEHSCLYFSYKWCLPSAKEQVVYLQQSNPRSMMIFCRHMKPFCEKKLRFCIIRVVDKV